MLKARTILAQGRPAAAETAYTLYHPPDGMIGHITGIAVAYTGSGNGCWFSLYGCSAEQSGTWNVYDSTTALYWRVPTTSVFVRGADVYSRIEWALWGDRDSLGIEAEDAGDITATVFGWEEPWTEQAWAEARKILRQASPDTNTAIKLYSPPTDQIGQVSSMQVAYTGGTSQVFGLFANVEEEVYAEEQALVWRNELLLGAPWHREVDWALAGDTVSLGAQTGLVADGSFDMTYTLWGRTLDSA